MNKITIDAIGGAIFIVLGLIFVICHIQIAHRTAEFYYRLLRLHFSERGYQICFLLMGIIFIILGLLFLLRIIKFKW